MTAEAFHKAIKISNGYNLAWKLSGAFVISVLSLKREGSYSFALWRSCRGGTLRAFAEVARYSTHRHCYDILTLVHEAFSLIC